MTQSNEKIRGIIFFKSVIYAVRCAGLEEDYRLFCIPRSYERGFNMSPPAEAKKKSVWGMEGGYLEDFVAVGSIFGAGDCVVGDTVMCRPLGLKGGERIWHRRLTPTAIVCRPSGIKSKLCCFDGGRVGAFEVMKYKLGKQTGCDLW